jgi:sugar lactone lactonase YvrE
MMSATRVVALWRITHLGAQGNSEMKRLNEAKWGTKGAGVGKSIKLSLACVAVAVMLAACGGGGDTPAAEAKNPDSVARMAGTVVGLTAEGLVLTNGTDTVTLAANATSFTLPEGGTLAVAQQPLGFRKFCEVGGTPGALQVNCSDAAAKVSWAAGLDGVPQSNTPPVPGPDGRFYFVSNSMVYSVLPSGEGGYRLLAGSPYAQGVVDGVGEAARFNSPQSMVMDADGNGYVLDSSNNGVYSIRKFTPAGAVSTIASGFGGANPNLRNLALGPNNQLYLVSLEQNSTNSVQRFNAQGQLEVLFNTGSVANSTSEITAMAVGTDGTIYWADNVKFAIYKLAPGGSTPVLLAGSGTGDSCYLYDTQADQYSTVCVDGTGQTARFGNIRNLVVDSQGVVYASDENGNLLRRISAAGDVTTIVGNASAPVSGNTDGTGAAATLSDGNGISLSADGTTLYVGQGGSADLRVVSNLSANGADVTTLLAKATVLANPPSAARQALLHNMSRVAADASGNLFVNELVWADFSTVIRKISPQGGLSTLATSVLSNRDIRSLKVGADGLPYLAGVCSIERIALNGTVTTLVGNPAASICNSADGPAGTAGVRDIIDIAPDAAGNVYLSQPGFVLRKLASDGSISTLTLVDANGAAFPATYWTALVVDAQGRLYASSSNQVFKVVVQGTQGTVSRVAGSNSFGNADGDALTQATFHSINNLTLDAAGNLYVMDDSSLLRQITPAGQVLTLAGGGGNGDAVDGIGAGVGFRSLVTGGLAVTPGGTLYVVDSGKLRKVEAVKAPNN